VTYFYTSIHITFSVLLYIKECNPAIYLSHLLKVGRCHSVFSWKSWWSVRFRCLYMRMKCRSTASIAYSLAEGLVAVIQVKMLAFKI